YFMNRKIKNYSRDREVYSESIYIAANEALSGIKEIQANDAQGYFIKRFSEATKKYQDSYRKFSVLSNLPQILAIGLPGNRDDAMRAGIIPITFILPIPSTFLRSPYNLSLKITHQY
ncbi:hypothetical protein MEO41_28450, partial [Dolichospermum sp. ST_sed4]|nr:hypothetical protein [Dolichospermum sp. ST_sed4]